MLEESGIVEDVVEQNEVEIVGQNSAELLSAEELLFLGSYTRVEEEEGEGEPYSLPESSLCRCHCNSSSTIYITVTIQFENHQNSIGTHMEVDSAEHNQWMGLFPLEMNVHSDYLLSFSRHEQYDDIESIGLIRKEWLLL